MKPGSDLYRMAARLAGVLFLWAALANGAWGQEKKEEAARPAPFLVPYALVILSIGLGMMVLCRSSRRQDRAKSEALPAGLTPEQLRAGTKPKAPAGPVRRGKEMSEEAKSALTVAIVGVVLPVLGLLLGAFALWKSLQAKKHIKENPRLTGENVAMAGMIVGGVAIAVGLIWLIVLIAKVF